MGHPLTTAYTTLGPEGLQHSLDEPSVRMVFTNSALLGTLAQVVDQCPSLVWVIYDGEDTVDQVCQELLPVRFSLIMEPRRVSSRNSMTSWPRGNDLDEFSVSPKLWSLERPTW
jgi:long-subunit acyl-CoA synthetase (AMP-forming)